MDAAPIRGNKEVDHLVREFDERLRLAHASELASGNRLLEAMALLCQEGAGKASAAELDLLARINVRQCLFAEARKRWEQAIAREESRRGEFEQCLQVLEVYRTQWFKRRMIEWWVTLALLVVSLGIGIWTLIRQITN
jgi:hypothetical protein